MTGRSIRADMLLEVEATSSGKKSAWVGALLRRVALAVATVLLAGLFATVMMRYAPGYGMDGIMLDPSISEEARERILAERYSQASALEYYPQLIGRLATGQWGMSPTLNQPIDELIMARMPVTLRVAGTGLAIAWIAGFGIAILAAWRGGMAEVAGGVIAGAGLCVPAGLAALLFLFYAWPAAAAVGLAVAPRILALARGVLAKAGAAPSLLGARARGLSERQIFFGHVMPGALPGLAALAGVSFSMAIGATIPVEVICGEAGLGELAWRAAQGRDMPLLTILTMLIAVITLLANSSAETISASARSSTA